MRVSCCGSIVRKRNRELVQNMKDCNRKGVVTLIRSMTMFLILREPAALATAVETNRNEDTLTRKDQQLSQEPSTSRQWVLNSNDTF